MSSLTDTSKQNPVGFAEQASTGVKKLRQLIEDIPVAMLTTAAPDGAIRTRPMAHQQLDDDGNLWFFSNQASPKSAELEQNENVNVSYLNNSKGVYISVCGEAYQVRDMEKARELWSPDVSAWFPNGLSDPSLTLIRVKVTSAEYWERTAGFIKRALEYTKSIITGKAPDIAENKTIHLHSH